MTEHADTGIQYPGYSPAHRQFSIFGLVPVLRSSQETTVSGNFFLAQPLLELRPVAAEDLVRRDFTADRPDAVWLSDFTYIRTWQGWGYLSIVLDVHTRRIVGWQLASHMGQSLVTDALDMALASRREHERALGQREPIYVLRVHRAPEEGRHRPEQGPDRHGFG